MATRTICIQVRDYVMHQNGESAGASGSDRAAALRLCFDESWAGTTKTVYFTDAREEGSTSQVLGLDNLVEGETETYDVPIPANALQYEGRATVTVRGVKLDQDGATELAITTAAIVLKVLDSKLPETVGELGQVDATAAEQLQAEIDGLKALFITSASQAKASQEAAAASEANAKASEEAAQESQTKAAASERAAKQSQDCAASSESNAKQSEEKAASSQSAARTSEENAAASETAAKASERAARASQDAAQESREAAQASEAAAKESQTQAASSEASASSSAAQAVAAANAAGGSEKNAAASETEAAYWASVAEGAAGGGVTTFKGRAGAVQPEEGDYTPEMVGADPAGTGAAQAAAQVKAHNEDKNAHKALMDQVKTTLRQHTGDTSNPHKVTKEQIGLGAVDNTSDEDKPVSKATQAAIDQSSGMALLGGGGTGTGELEDLTLQCGRLVNAGAGWQSYLFPGAFEGVPIVLLQPVAFSGWVEVRDVTTEGFSYRLVKPVYTPGSQGSVTTGSYYTASGTSSSSAHTQNTLVSGVTLPTLPKTENRETAEKITVFWLAIEEEGEDDAEQ